MTPALPRDTDRAPAPHVARRLLVVLGVLVLVIAIGAAVVVLLATTPWGNERVRRVVVSQANQRLTGQLSIERLCGNLFSGATLTGVRVTDSAAHPIFSARSVQLRYDFWAALHRRIVIESLVLDTASVLFDKQPGARWNFQALMRPSGAPADTSRRSVPPELANVTIHAGQFIWRRPWHPDSALPADKRDAAIAAAMSASARSRTERVPNGFQRVLHYHDIDAHLPTVNFAQAGRPTAVRIAALSMLAEPYRPPAIDVRSLVGTLYASKDSLWWTGARMALPGSQVTGDGRIGFNHSGFTLHLQGAPVALADFRWLNPKIPAEGGGRLVYAMHLHGDTAEYTVANADLRSGESAVKGDATISRIHPAVGRSTVLVHGADIVVSRLSTELLHRLAPSVALRRSGVLDGRLAVDGSLDALRVDGDLRFADSQAGTSRLVARGLMGFTGGLSVHDFDLRLLPLQLATLSGGAGAGARLPPLRGSVTGRVHADGTARALRFTAALRSANGGGSLTGGGMVQPAGSRTRYDVAFVLDALNAAAFSRRAPATHLTGTVSARGQGFAPSTANAVVAADLVASRYDTLAVDRLIAQAAVSRGLLRADSIVVVAGGAAGRAAGTFGLVSGREGVMHVDVAVDSLRPLRRWLGMSDSTLAGALSATGELRGNVSRPGVVATAQGRDVVVRGYAVQRLMATLSSQNVRDRAQPVAFQATVRQDSLVSYAALGSYARSVAGVQRVHLDSLSARFDTLAWRLAHPATVAFDHGALALDSVELRSLAGERLYANGIVPAAGTGRLDLAAEHVQAATLLSLLRRHDEAAGVLDATVHLTGSRAEPAFTGKVALHEASYRGTRAPDVSSTLRYEGRRLAMAASAHDSSGRLVLSGNASLPLDLSLEPVTGSRRIAGDLVADVALDSLQLATLPIPSRTIADLRGSTAGGVHVRGSWKAPRYGGHAALRGGGATVVATGMRLDGAAADLRLVQDTLHLDSLVARARGTMRAEGTVDLTDRARPFVHLRAQARNVRVMDQRRGLVDADGEMTAEGPLNAIQVSGRATMLGGFLALKQFRKDLLRVKSPGDLTYFMPFDTTTPARVAARSAAALARPKKIGVIADLALEVDRGNYYRNRPDANTEFYTGRGEELRAHIDTRSGDAWALGFVRIGDGVAIFRARDFAPARGSLTFARYTDGPGLVQQTGEREIWEAGRGVMPVQLLTGGTSKAPAIGLEAGTLFPIRGRELNGYLTMGRAHTSLLQQSGSSLSGSEGWSGQLSGETGALARRQQAATALGVVLHDIGTGATKEYGLDALSMSPVDVPTELVFGKTGGVRGALVEGGRYLTTDLYLGGQLRLTRGIPGLRMSQQFGTDYQLDVGLEPRFLFRAPEDLGITHPTVRTGVFGAFLTRSWDW